jgi:hypothetical protein
MPRLRPEQAASLGRLIHEITQTPQALTRDWHVAIWVRDDHDENDQAYWKRAGGKYWDDNLGGSVGHHVDPSITATDLADLREGSEKVRRYVDKHVAHSTPA